MKACGLNKNDKICHSRVGGNPESPKDASGLKFSLEQNPINLIFTMFYNFSSPQIFVGKD